MRKMISRREFLKFSGLSFGGLALGVDFPPGREETPPITLGRVGYPSISVFDAPKLNANTVGYRFRDELLNIYRKLTPFDGPAYNPLWFRIWGGYVHSAFVQLVEIKFNEPMGSASEGGVLTEMSVPYSQPYDYSSADGWQSTSEFRLYYGSTHWVVDVVEGPGKFPWYKIEDELYAGYYYYVPAAHLRPIPEEELMPISPDVPPGDKRIEVSLTHQVLTAYEGDQIVMRTQVSTGIPSNTLVGGYPTETPVGNHFVLSKTPSKHMGTSRLTDSLGDRALPGVPWTAFFAEGGYAIHGAYWHNNFGLPMSRGCINMRNSDAKWLWRWTTPVWNPEVNSSADWEVRGLGTAVTVVE